MLDAYDPAFRYAYPNGAWVFDARGRMLRNVIACNPETGEVIAAVLFTGNPLSWIRAKLRRVLPRSFNWWLYPTYAPRRHGFWPAPLRIIKREPLV